MKLGKTLQVSDRRAWRSWLARHHDREKEIWLVYPRRATGHARISYNAAVEEALCYGWIDSTLKSVDATRLAQRFSPRRRASGLSQMNRERVRELIAKKKMTRAGLAAIAHVFDPKTDAAARFRIAPDITRALKADAAAWREWRRFPARYRRIRVAYVEHARSRGANAFQTRLANLVKMTARGKRIGFVRD